MTPLLTAFTGTPEKNQVYNLDLFELCAAMPSQSVDMILCDLPYGQTDSSWDEIIPFSEMWMAFKRIMRPGSVIVLTASQPFTSLLVCSNLKWFRYEWVWDKIAVANFLNVKREPLMHHESVLIFCDSGTPYYPQFSKQVSSPFGKKSASLSGAYGEHGADYQTGVGYPKSILTYMRPNNLTGGGLHPNQKPVDLFRYLIRTYTEVGQVVFDPCVGSGTTAIAAREEGRSFIVGDSSLEYVEIARARLAAPYTPSFMPQLEMAG